MRSAVRVLGALSILIAGCRAVPERSEEPVVPLPAGFSHVDCLDLYVAPGIIDLPLDHATTATAFVGHCAAAVHLAVEGPSWLEASVDDVRTGETSGAITLHATSYPGSPGDVFSIGVVATTEGRDVRVEMPVRVAAVFKGYGADGRASFAGDPGQWQSLIALEDGSVAIPVTLRPTTRGRVPALLEIDPDGNVRHQTMLSAITARFVEVTDVTRTHDGGFAVCGGFSGGPTEPANQARFVARIRSDWTLDPAFGDGGVVRFPLGLFSDPPQSLVELPSGGIVVDDDNSPRLLRRDGTFDPDFVSTPGLSEYLTVLGEGFAASSGGGTAISYRADGTRIGTLHVPDSDAEGELILSNCRLSTSSDVRMVCVRNRRAMEGGEETWRTIALTSTRFAADGEVLSHLEIPDSDQVSVHLDAQGHIFLSRVTSDGGWTVGAFDDAAPSWPSGLVSPGIPMWGLATWELGSTPLFTFSRPQLDETALFRIEPVH